MRCGAQRGLTLLETVFAVAMLALVCASMFGTIDFVMTRDLVYARRLAAMELANRLMLQYLDDPTALEDDEGLPLRYHERPGADLYRWDLQAETVAIELSDAMAEMGDAERFADYDFEHLTVRVWLSEQSGGAYRPQDSPIVVELTRLIDPSAMRNPEQVNKLIHDPERIIEMFEGLQ